MSYLARANRNTNRSKEISPKGFSTSSELLFDIAARKLST
jgi:hypothetical protein